MGGGGDDQRGQPVVRAQRRGEPRGVRPAAGRTAAIGPRARSGGQPGSHAGRLAAAAAVGKTDRPGGLDSGASAVSESRKWVDVRIATYNIHRCRGLDRRTDPARIARVSKESDADIIAMQEVIGAGPAGTVDQAQEIGALTGMGWVMAPARELRGHIFGNVVMSRFPMRSHAQRDLTWRVCEHRNVQRVDLDLDGRILHLFNVHLGTALMERRYQAGQLAAYVHHKRAPGPKVVVGDFNEWSRGLATRLLSQKLKALDLYPHLR